MQPAPGTRQQAASNIQSSDYQSGSLRVCPYVCLLHVRNELLEQVHDLDHQRKAAAATATATTLPAAQRQLQHGVAYLLAASSPRQKEAAAAVVASASAFAFAIVWLGLD